jgi:hypothetical protein
LRTWSFASAAIAKPTAAAAINARRETMGKDYREIEEEQDAMMQKVAKYVLTGIVALATILFLVFVIPQRFKGEI